MGGEKWLPNKVLFFSDLYTILSQGTQETDRLRLNWYKVNGQLNIPFLKYFLFFAPDIPRQD